jgi:uncharacterized repeat protein (TIGR03803 family)
MVGLLWEVIRPRSDDRVAQRRISMRTKVQWGSISRGASRALALIVLVSPGVANPSSYAPTMTALYFFEGGTDGSGPYAGVIQDAAGNLYGTTVRGGNLACFSPLGCGVVYKVDATGKETVLYSFKGGKDGAFPTASLVRDATGNLYGTTSGRGSGYGVVFKVDTTGKETVLHSFTGKDGAYPYGGLVRDAEGNLYGTTPNGGVVGGTCTVTNGCGTVFKVSAAGKFTMLHAFTGGADGATPYIGRLIQDSVGNLYGTTLEGGVFGKACSAGCGVVFKLNTNGNEAVLYNFCSTDNCSDGAYPYAGLVRDAKGNLYSTTTGGGLGGGVVFELDKDGKETVLHDFTGANGDGSINALVLGAKGALYGVAQGDSKDNEGTVFRLSTTGIFTVLHTFDGGPDGGQPYGDLIRDAAGNIYGTATANGGSGYGVVFKLTS